MRLSKNLYLAVCCLLSFYSFSQSPTHIPKYVSMTANSNGYYEYLPQGYNPLSNQKYPVLLFLHGAGDIGNGSSAELPRLLLVGIPKLINQGSFPDSFNTNGQTSKFIIISPQFSNYPADSIAVIDVENILNYIGQNYNVDLNRVYVTGLSMGGGFTFNYAGTSAAKANRLAAIVPIANASYPVVEKSRTIAEANLPVWATHNDLDPSVPVDQTTLYVSWINQAPAPTPLAKQTIFSNNIHDSWTATYDTAFKENGLNIYQWMLQFQRPIILPVSLINYKATVTGNKVSITWTTTNELNNAFFTIERSPNGTDFKTIGRVTGSNLPDNYIFVDNNPLTTTNFYRLSQIDRDGKITYYKIIQVRLTDITTQGLSIYPNPANNQLTIFLNSEKQGDFTVSIISANGAQLKQWLLKKHTPVLEETLLLTWLPPGNYFVQLRSKNYMESKPFLKN